MTATITGNYPPIERLETGFYSLDMALSNPSKNQNGIPLTMYEVYGWEGVGKSTFVQSLSAIIGREQKKNIALSPIEEIDIGLLQSIADAQGFDGEIHIWMEKEDEKTIDKLLEDIHNQETKVGIIDSIGAISPIAELEADSTADINMGRRAMLVAKLSRGISHAKRFEETPLTFFMVSHMHAIIGSRGTETSGGKVKGYLSKVRIRLKRDEAFEKDGSYVLEGTVEKLSYGPRGRTFKVFCLAGQGLHKGLSTIIDCETLKLSKRENGVIKMDGKSYGRITKLIEDAHNKDVDFSPFFEALKGSTNNTASNNEEEKENEE